MLDLVNLVDELRYGKQENLTSDVLNEIRSFVYKLKD